MRPSSSGVATTNYSEISVGHVLVASDRSNGGTRRAPGILWVLCEDYKTERGREDYAPFDQARVAERKTHRSIVLNKRGVRRGVCKKSA